MVPRFNPPKVSDYGTSSSAGSYNWSVADVAFGSPEQLAERKTKRDADRTRPNKRGIKHRRGTVGHSKDFHRKHG